jgi:hypothetical protein
VRSRELESALSCYQRAESAHTLRLSRELPGQGYCLTPMVFGEQGQAVVLAYPGGLELLEGPMLAPTASWRLGDDEVFVPQGALLLRVLPHQHEEVRKTILLFGDRSVRRYPPLDASEDYLHLGWDVIPPGRADLIGPPLAWFQRDLEVLELAAPDPLGGLNWVQLECTADRLRFREASHSGNLTRYLAATIPCAGQVVGVSAEGIDWFRSSGGRLTAWSSCKLPLDQAIACAASPRTGELLVVCGDGQVVRVRSPQ